MLNVLTVTNMRELRMMVRNVDLTTAMLDNSCWKQVSVFTVHLIPGLLMIKRSVGPILVQKHKNYSKTENVKIVLNTPEPKAKKIKK